MVDREHHRKRLHKKARAVHLWLLPAAVVVPLAWLYFAYGLCQETDSALTVRACGTIGSPVGPVLAGVLLLAWLAHDLAALGAPEPGERRAHHTRVRHGFHSLEDHHKEHVRLAVRMILGVTAALAAGVALLAYRTTH